MSVLVGKVVGVMINSLLIGVGGVVCVIMCGFKFIIKDNNVLYVIDGIFMFNVNVGGVSDSCYFIQVGLDGVVDLNLDDIESINMLIGFFVVVFYGNVVVNGVVLINIKKGNVECILFIVINNIIFLDVYMMFEMQNRYGNMEGVFESWGGIIIKCYDFKKFFNMGLNVINMILFLIGIKKNQMYVFVLIIYLIGIIFNNLYSCYNFFICNMVNFLNDKLIFDLSVNYII